MSVIVNIVLFCAHLCVLCSGTPAFTHSYEEKSPGYEFNNLTGHWYKFHTEAASWRVANRTCGAEGAQLAVANSAAEETVLVELFERYPAAALHGAHTSYMIYVGIFLESGVWRIVDGHWFADGIWRTANGVWRTVDGPILADAGYAHWAPGYPKYGIYNPCAVMARNGTLTNRTGGASNAFICEMAHAPRQ